MDFSTIFAGLNASSVVPTLIAAAAIAVVIGFAGTISRIVGRFFEAGPTFDPKADRTIGGWYSHEQGMTGYESNHSAVSKSINRHVRKGGS